HFCRPCPARHRNIQKLEGREGASRRLFFHFRDLLGFSVFPRHRAGSPFRPKPAWMTLPCGAKTESNTMVEPVPVEFDFTGVPPPRVFEPPPGSKVVPRRILSPIHHYLSRSRKPFWSEDLIFTQPPRIYVDQKSVFREIASVTQLRRGDHCMITLNVLRCLSPWIDYLVSLMGSLELSHLYHHFVILEDVDHVDQFGVPRTKQGAIVHIMEYSNTVEGFIEEVRVKSFGEWLALPKVFLDCILQKARCGRVPLADYGDMPHIFRMEERLTEQQRERIVHDAEQFIANPQAYNILWSNCEHTTNLVSGKQQFTSPEVHFFLWSICRYFLTFFGLATLHAVTMQCYSRYCLQYPFWALAAYYTCTALPVLAQIVVQFGRLAHTVAASWRKSLISRNDVYHLLLKELSRAIFNGALAFGFLLQGPPFSTVGAGHFTLRRRKVSHQNFCCHRVCLPRKRRYLCTARTGSHADPAPNAGSLLAYWRQRPYVGRGGKNSG
ncbi:unnamed protein product, partial [Effrenium voratum]